MPIGGSCLYSEGILAGASEIQYKFGMSETGRLETLLHCGFCLMWAVIRLLATPKYLRRNVLPLRIYFCA
jgi:hypothetical protein